MWKFRKFFFFEFIKLFDQKSKNSFVSYFENIEISIVVNMLFHEHFIHENDFVIEIFDFDIALNVFSKISLIQHIENLKTIKKNSICIYEFFVFFVFDQIIDIDFEIYTIDIETIIQCFVISFKRKMQLLSFRDFALRNKSFNWNRLIFSINRRIFSIFICIIISNVTIDFIKITKIVDIANIEFCKKKQLFCFTMYFCIIISNIDFYDEKQFFCFVDFFVSIFVECVVSEHNDFYKKKQFCFFVDIDEIVDIVVTRNDAFTLIVDIIKKKNLIECRLWIWYYYWFEFESNIWLKNRNIKNYRKWKSNNHQNRNISRIKKSTNHCWNICQIRIQNRFVFWHSTTIKIFEIIAKYVYEIIKFSNVRNKNQYIWNICCFRIQICFVFWRFAKSNNVQYRKSRIDIRYSIFRICKTINWYYAIATKIKFYFFDFSIFFDICFTNFLFCDAQRDLFDLIFDVNIVMRKKIRIACLKMI